MTLLPGSISADGRQFFDSDRWGWQPLWLTRDEVLDAATALFAVPVGGDASYLAMGMLNQSWRVGDHVLRVSRPERSAPQIRYEHQVLSRLHRRVPEIVVPLTGRNGVSLQWVRDRPVTLFPFIEGTLGSDLPVDRRIGPTATMMARAHRASMTSLALSQRPGYSSADDRTQWLWPRLAPMLRREVEGADHYFALFDEETQLIEAWLDRLSLTGRSLPRAVVQGDTNPRNLIFGDDGIVAVIDWDECRIDPLHAAVAREAFAADGVDPEDFWQTYQGAGGPLDADSFELLYGFARLTPLIELMWTDQNGSANPYALETIRAVAADIEMMRERVPL